MVSRACSSNLLQNDKESQNACGKLKEEPVAQTNITCLMKVAARGVAGSGPMSRMAERLFGAA